MQVYHAAALSAALFTVAGCGPTDEIQSAWSKHQLVAISGPEGTLHLGYEAERLTHVSRLDGLLGPNTISFVYGSDGKVSKVASRSTELSCDTNIDYEDGRFRRSVRNCGTPDVETREERWYDDSGRCIGRSIERDLGAFREGHRQTFEYSAGKIVEHHEFLSARRDDDADDDGWMWRPIERPYTFRLDARGRLLGIQFSGADPGLADVALEYEEDRLKSVRRPSGAQVIYEYDVHGRLVREVANDYDVEEKLVERIYEYHWVQGPSNLSQVFSAVSTPTAWRPLWGAEASEAMLPWVLRNVLSAP